MQAAQSIAVVREFLDTLSGKPMPADVVERYVAESDESLWRHILHYEAAFPRFGLVAQDLFARGCCVWGRLIMRGTHAGDLWFMPPAGMQIALPLLPTHTGEFMGLAPTGRVVILPMVTIFRVSDSRIVEHRLHYDCRLLLRQLGILPRRPNEAEVRFDADLSGIDLPFFDVAHTPRPAPAASARPRSRPRR